MKKGAFQTLVFLFTTLFIAQHAQAKTLQWVGCGISKKGFMEELAAAYKKETGVIIELEGGGATKGLRQVSSGQSDFGGSCRMPLISKNPDGTYHIESSEEKLKLIPVGWDALVVITNKANKLTYEISRENLKKVLTGEITHWRQLGAETDAPINIYVRSGKISGVGLTLRQQLFNNREQAFSEKATFLPSSGKIEMAVAADPNALAVSGISSSRHRDVNILSLEGVAPTMENLRTGRYQLYRLLFLVAPMELTEKPDHKAFVDFALSVKGQAAIRKAGTLPYTYGLHLMRESTSDEYILSLDIIDQSGIYSPDGD